MQGGRPENQDDVGGIDTPLGYLLIVCDGMGGGPAGKAAASIVKNSIARTLCESSPQAQREHALKMAVARAQEALMETARENPSMNGMGSTFVALLINARSALVAHAGDSRCYRLHGRRCLYRSHDHSLVAELVRKKALTEEQARISPQSNVITRGLGSMSNHIPDIEEMPYKRGDRFVLCTDGVWGSMPHAQLLQKLTQQVDLQTLATQLSNEIDRLGFAKGGGHDNHTIAIVEMENNSQLQERLWKRWMTLPLAGFCVLLLLTLTISKLLKPDDSTHQTTAPAGIQTMNQTPSAEKTHAATAGTTTQDGKTSVVLSTPQRKAEESSQPAEPVRSDIVSNDSTQKPDKKDTADEKTGDIVAAQETTQKIINRHQEAHKLSEKTVKAAEQKIDGLRTEIQELASQLLEQIQGLPSIHGLVDSLVAEDKKSLWYVDKVDAKTKRCGLTAATQKLIDKQISKYEEVRSMLSQEKKKEKTKISKK